MGKNPTGGRRMKRLAIGTVQFGLPYGITNQAGQVTRSEAKEILQLAEGNGIDTLDTAIAYGESETCLGEIGVQGFRLVTKLPAIPKDCANVSSWARNQFSASLTRLSVTTVYGLLLHRPEQLLGPNGMELYRVLQDFKGSGQVKKVGVSIYAPSELELITKSFLLDLVQAPFNLMDRRLYTTGWLQKLKDNGVEIHTRSAFLQGLLLMPRATIPPKFAPWNDLWDRWHKWHSDHDTSAIQVCLAFPLAFPEVDRVVVGVDSVSQLGQIISAAAGDAPSDLPDLSCDAEDLINPTRWSYL